MAVKKVKEEPKVYRTYEDYPFEDLCTYAGIDCLVTSQLLAKIFPLVAEQKAYTFSKSGQAVPGTAPAILDFMHSVEMPAHEYICDMEINGFKYDVDLSTRQAREIEAELPVLEDKVFSLMGGSKFNLDSGKELAKVLYEDNKFEPPSFTKHNEPSVDGDALIALASTHDLEWLKVLARRNNLASVYRTFFRSYVADFVKSDGRIHPGYSLFGTSSYRVASQDPNLTQIPNDVTENRLGYSVKRCFTVEKGNLLICADYSSAEVVVLANLSCDPKLMQAVAEGRDFHSFSASSMWGIPYEEFVAALNYEGSDPSLKELKKARKTMRQNAKALTFGILYGSSNRGLANTLGITEQDAIRLVESYFKTYPLIKQYVEDSHRMAQWNFRTLNEWGQAKQQFGAMPSFRETAVFNASLRNSQNVRIQSTSSTMGLAAFTWLNGDLKSIGGSSLACVYDSTENEVPYKRGAEAIEMVFSNLEDRPVREFDWLKLPIRIDCEVGTNWKDMVKVPRGITQPQLEKLLLDKLGIPIAA